MNSMEVQVENSEFPETFLLELSIAYKVDYTLLIEAPLIYSSTASLIFGDFPSLISLSYDIFLFHY